jgi:hypothetical protein
MNVDTNALRKIAERSTPEPRKCWTGNSAGRLTAGRGPDGGVLHSSIVRRHHADVACGAAIRTTGQPSPPPPSRPCPIRPKRLVLAP